MNVLRPALVQLSFAPKELINRRDECEQAHEYLRKVWDACTAFGMTEANKKLDLDTSFPNDISVGSAQYTLRAAKLDRSQLDRENEAVIFEYQDVLGVLVELKSTGEDESTDFWQETFSHWRTVLREHLLQAQLSCDVLPSGMLGETYIFRGFVDDKHLASTVTADNSVLDLSSLPGNIVFTEDAHTSINNYIALSISILLPDEISNWDQSLTYLTDKEFCLLEGSSIGGRRATAVLAPMARMASANTWTVWAGSSQLAPFVRYLLHTAKVNFAALVLERDLQGLRSGRVRVDQMLDEFFKSCAKIIDREKELSHSDLDRLRTEIIPLKLAKYGLITSVSRLKELLISVRTAQKNLEPLIPSSRELTVGNSLFDRDKRMINWLLDQLSIEIEYIGATKERIEEGNQLLETRMDEETQRASFRLNDLILYQGSVLSAILVGLTALQSFRAVALREPIQWAMTILLMACALSLPSLLAHWVDRYNLKDAVIGGVLAASIGNCLAVLFAEYMPVIKVSDSVWTAYRFFVVLAGLVAGYLVVLGVRRVKR